MATEFEISSSIARVYAEALLDLSTEQGSVDDIESELVDLVKLWREDASFAALMQSVAIDSDARAASLQKIFGGRVSPIVLNLMMVLNRKGRTMLLPHVCDAFGKLLDRQRGRERVFVTTAVELNDDLRDRVRAAANALSGRESVLVERVEPALLGGMQLQIGDQVLDTSLKSRLRRMRQSLNATMERTMHGGADKLMRDEG
jgi:F-type H+-transporting ATPase subunit delta